jgi:hypothetical protein
MKDKIPFIRNPIETIDGNEEPDVCFGTPIARHITPATFSPTYLVECDGMEYYIMPTDLFHMTGTWDGNWSVMADGGELHHKGLYYHNSGKKPENWEDYENIQK